DKEYNLTQGKPGSKIVWFTANANGEAETLRITLKPKQRMKVLQFDVDLANLLVKGKLARGNVVTKAEIHRISLKEKGVSTLGGREVWFDPDVLRINYDGRGNLLGEFFNDEKILVIMKNGDFFTTTYDAENHYDEGILRIEKYREGVVWTAVLNDADQGFTYIKRFNLEQNAKKQRMIGENPKSELLLLTDERYPRFEVKFGGADSFREPLVIDAEEFIGVKSFKAKGKRVSNWTIDSITEIEPRKVEEEEVMPQVATIDEEMVDSETAGADSVIDQEAVRDQLTGQMRIFDDVNDEEE
ncbi:MAG: DNA gyrase/topoisomerase IV subunit A, partial [Muribaculaceae bacterium]